MTNSESDPAQLGRKGGRLVWLTHGIAWIVWSVPWVMMALVVLFFIGLLLPPRPASPSEEELEVAEKLREAGAEVHFLRGHIRAVHFANTPVKDADLAHLEPLTDLWELGLENTAITDAGLKHLSGLKALTYLYLENTGITDAGLTHLTGLKKLEMLVLDGTEVTDQGVRDLAHIKSLHSLHIKRTAITKEGVEELQQALPKCSIYWQQDGARVPES